MVPDTISGMAKAKANMHKRDVAKFLKSSHTSFDISLPSDKYDLFNLSELIQQYSILYKTINIHLTKDFHDLKYKNNGLQIYIPSNITVNIYGDPVNGTVIDMTNFSFFYSIEMPYPGGQKIKFENIKIYNFTDLDHKNVIFYSRSLVLNYNIIFKNCIFDTSTSVVYRLDYQKDAGLLDLKDNYQVTFDSCQFKNIKMVKQNSSRNTYYSYKKHYDNENDFQEINNFNLKDSNFYNFHILVHLQL